MPSFAHDKTMTSFANMLAVPEEFRCKYIQALCYNERGIKRNGERHNLCDYHRQNANAAQHRFAKKKREDNKRQLRCRIGSSKKKVNERVKDDISMNATNFLLELNFEMSDLIPLGEVTSGNILQLESIISNADDYEWLETALLPVNPFPHYFA